MDSLTMSLVGMIVSVMLALFGLVFRRLNLMDTRLRQAPGRDEVREIIKDKMEPTVVLQRELKEDIKNMNHKLDKLLDRMRTGS